MRSTITLSVAGLLALAGLAGSGSSLLASRSNYLKGGDDGWCPGIPNYERVHYRNVYDGIDLVFYGNGGKLEYDFVVRPGADPGRIGFSIDGTLGLRIDAAGDLVMPQASTTREATRSSSS